MDWVETAFRNFDYDAFRARLKNALRAEDILWSELCRRAKVPTMGALSAIEDCETDFRLHLEVLEKLAAPLGRDARWLLTGESADNAIIVGLRERTHALVDEFIYKEQVAQEEGSRLHHYVDNKLDTLFTQTPQAAYRCGIPETWRDVGYLYQEMRTCHG